MKPVVHDRPHRKHDEKLVGGLASQTELFASKKAGVFAGFAFGHQLGIGAG